MRTQRFAVIGALVAGASVVGAWLGGAALAQPEEHASAPVRIATVDLYMLAERVMNRAELLKPRESIDAKYQQQLQGLEKQIQEIDTKLTALERTPQDPQVRPLFEQRQSRVEQYQEAMQKFNEEKEQLMASQLGGVYREIRGVAANVAQQRGYTHVLASRRLDEITRPQTAGDALQDMLARPALIAPEADEITDEVAAELKVDLTQPPPQPAQPAPAAPQGGPAGPAANPARR